MEKATLLFKGVGPIVDVYPFAIKNSVQPPSLESLSNKSTQIDDSPDSPVFTPTLISVPTSIAL